MRYRVLIQMLCIAGLAQSVYADEIIFINGDRLTGKIDHVLEGKLVFKSDVIGKVTIEMSKIQTFSTDAPVSVYLKDDNVLLQKIESSEPGKFTIAGAGIVKAQAFDFSAISSINPPPKPEPKWTGNISAGLTSTHVNTKTDNISASANLSKRTEKDRTKLSADYAKARQKDPDTGEKNTTEDWWRSKAKYDYFLTKKLYGYLDGRYEKDAIAQLDRRVIVGSGGGYQWIESEDMNFSTEAGLASLYEKFEDQTDSNSEISVQAGYNFDKRLMKNVRFINELTYYPSTEQLSDYFLTSTAEVRANFTETMFTNFKVIFGYDATPAIGTGATDVKYIWGIGYNF